MADQTKARDPKFQPGHRVAFKAAAVNLFMGEIVNINSSGYAKKGADVSGEICAGVCSEDVSNSGGAAGDKDALVWQEGCFEFVCASATQAWVGQKVYAVDSQTVALAATTTNDVLVGRVTEFISATAVRVRITPEV